MKEAALNLSEAHRGRGRAAAGARGPHGSAGPSASRRPLTTLGTQRAPSQRQTVSRQSEDNLVTSLMSSIEGGHSLHWGNACLTSSGALLPTGLGRSAVRGAREGATWERRDWRRSGVPVQGLQVLSSRGR